MNARKDEHPRHGDRRGAAFPAPFQRAFPAAIIEVPHDRCSVLPCSLCESPVSPRAFPLVVGLWLAWTAGANRDSRASVHSARCSTAALALPAPVLCYYLLCVWGRVWPFTGTQPGGRRRALRCRSLVWAARAAFASLDPNLGNAARSLGASGWRVFWRMELPLVLRPILAATALAFGRALAESLAAFWHREPTQP